jgi:hypothetical protein
VRFQIARSIALTLTLALTTNIALAQSEDAPGQPHTITLDAQGQGDRAEFAANPNVRAFYELSIKSLRKHRINVEKYEQASYAIFRELGRSIGVSPEGMVDHLKGIPWEMVTIVERDPATLDSYENFLTALMGPP